MAGENYELDYTNTSTQQATAGDIRNGPIFNISSVGSIGTVKLLALCGLGWLFYKIYKGK